MRYKNISKIVMLASAISGTFMLTSCHLFLSPIAYNYAHRHGVSISVAVPTQENQTLVIKNEELFRVCYSPIASIPRMISQNSKIYTSGTPYCYFRGKIPSTMKMTYYVITPELEKQLRGTYLVFEDYSIDAKGNKLPSDEWYKNGDDNVIKYLDNLPASAWRTHTFDFEALTKKHKNVLGTKLGHPHLRLELSIDNQGELKIKDEKVTEARVNIWS